jgi:Icc-related predicted phosphoesterase
MSINPELWHLLKGDQDFKIQSEFNDPQKFTRSNDPLRITVLSDTHTKHHEINSESLPGGNLIIHAGDLMNSGYKQTEITDFLTWFDSLNQYDAAVFIAGNHDRFFEYNPEEVKEILSNVWSTYLQDNTMIYINKEQTQGCKIYGSPWQPEFYNWAFNLPRNGWELEQKWNQIPKDTDILVTHGPPQDHLDVSGPPYNQPHLGCELLRVKVNEQPPKIHVFGHIHGGYGYKFHNDTHFINAAILNERYTYTNEPLTFDWYPVTNEIKFL